MSWQACPVCLGTGYDPFGGCHNTAYPSCRHCDGKRIIDEQTGYAQNPPSSEPVEKLGALTPVGINFRDKLYLILRELST